MCSLFNRIRVKAATDTTAASFYGGSCPPPDQPAGEPKQAICVWLIPKAKRGCIMRRDILSTILAVICVVFLVSLGIFYIQEGSFEGAGRKMDATLQTLPEDTARVANDVADKTDAVIEDIADGPDESPS
jgi:hypothetical protein